MKASKLLLFTYRFRCPACGSTRMKLGSIVNDEETIKRYPHLVLRWDCQRCDRSWFYPDLKEQISEALTDFMDKYYMLERKR